MNHANPRRQSKILFSTTKCLLVAVLIALPVLLFSQNAEVRNALKQIDNEQPSKGIAALEQLSKGDNSNTLYYLGLGYLRTGNPQKALAAFEKGISINEKDGLNYAGKGQVKLLQKRSNEGKMLLDKALALSKSKNAEVLRAVGEAYTTDSRTLMDAINHLNKSRSINNADAETHILLGDAYLILNKGGETVDAYERAASADPKWAKPQYKIAKVYQRSKNNALVMEHLMKAIAIDPEYAPAWKELGEQYYFQKAANKAVEAYEKYMSLSERADEVKFQYAFFLIMAKKFDKANAIFKDVLSKPNPPAIALKFAGLALLEKDTTRTSAQEAIPLLEQYFRKVKPEEIQAIDYAYYGEALLRTGQDSLANENFARSLAIDSVQLEIAELHAKTYYKRNKYPEAIQAYKQLMSIRKQPMSLDLWYLGNSYYYNAQYAEADTAFTKLSERQPNVTLGYAWSAKSRSLLDPDQSKGLAKPMYEKVIEVGTKIPDKSKKDMIDAYVYLGTYAVQKESNVQKAIGYFEKVLQLDPNNESAKKFMMELKKQ
jgi:tetratricopeptide (TPR) repeat protein